MSISRTTIPFAQVRFFEPLPKLYEVEARLTSFLRTRREIRQYRDLELGRITEEDVVLPHDLVAGHDKVRIATRALTYLERVHAATGMAHLEAKDRAQLEALRTGVSVACMSTEHNADVLAAALHEEMPWTAPATEHVWHAMRRSVREGRPGLRMEPLLLVGPPGIGKTYWAHRLGRLLEVPSTVIDGTGEPASFSIVGCQRGWGTAGPGKVLQTILKEKCAGPIVIVDEVEMAGDVQSSRGARFPLTDGLLPLLEPFTAATWQCPYYRIQCDMSWVGWVLTANSSLRGLPEPLLSRCPPLTLPPLSRLHLLEVAHREAERRGLPDTAIRTIECCL